MKNRETGRHGVTPGGLLGLALGSVLLLCGAGETPTGTVQKADIDAAGHNISNVAALSAGTISATNGITAPSVTATNFYGTLRSPWLVKSASWTASAGQRIQADTSGGTFTLTLPATAAVGDEIWVEDATGSFGAESLTIARNGLKINGTTDNYTANTLGVKLSAVYISTAYGWSIK